MSTTFSTEMATAFALDGERLKKLFDLLSDRVGPVRIELRCSDEVNRTYEDIKKAVEYENPVERRIETLRLTARSSDFAKSATLEFRSTGVLAGIVVDLAASEPVLTRLRSDILDILGGTRTWYSRFARLDFVSAGFLLLVIAWFVIVASVAFGWIRSENTTDDPRKNALAQLIGLGVPLLWGFVGVVLNRLWSSLFPVGSFLVGQGKRRDEFKEKVRWGIVIAFIVSLIAGMIPLGM